MPSKIEWTDETWNPVTGCSAVSPGCENCYAKRMANRLRGRFGYPSNDPFKVTLHPDRLGQPLKWKKPRRIFVVSMGDLFHDDVPDGFIMWVWWVMAQCSKHTFQVLTKRPERAVLWSEKWMDAGSGGEPVLARGPIEIREKHSCGRAHLFADMLDLWGKPPDGCAYPFYDWMEGVGYWPTVLPNVWIGVTAEDQQRADERIPKLLRIPAAVRFVSCEPLLGTINLNRWIARFSDGRPMCCECCNGDRCDEPRHVHRSSCKVCGGTGTRPVSLDWVIAGAETGQRARPTHPDWAYSLRDKCVAAKVPFFFKGWGEWLPFSQVYYLSREREEEVCAEMRKPRVYQRQTYFGATVVRGPDGPMTGTTPGVSPESIYPIGKKAAGRELDGEVWEQFPERNDSK